MYALKVQINGEQPIMAGTDDLSVRTATVNCIGRLGDNTRQDRAEGSPDLSITVGGLTSRASELPDEHLRWLEQRQLKIGDCVSVQLIDCLTAHAPIGGTEAEKRKHDERGYFEHCKRVYFELRENVEP